MARYTGPRVRISRRFGVPIFGPSKYLERRNYGPGMHGPKSRRKHTDYGLGLIEKQKLRYYYGLLERQFRGVYERALRRRGVTGEHMLQILKPGWTMCATTWVLPILAPPRASWSATGMSGSTARKVNIPSFGLKVNDVLRSRTPMRLASWPPRIWKAPPAGRARLALPEQGSPQGCRHAHPDPR